MIIGQQNLLNKLNQYTINTLPDALLFIGEPGCGKHTIAKYLADRLKLDYEVVSKDFSIEDLINYQQEVILKLCIIDIDEYTIAKQNLFLKLLEEAPQNIFFVVLTTSEFNVLPTIINRTVKYYFESYSELELQETGIKIDNNLIYKICNTPGQLIELNQKQFETTSDLAETFLLKANSMAISELLVYALKFNYKEDYDKLDPILFCKLLAYYAYSYYIETQLEYYYKIYIQTTMFLSKLLYKILNKENLMYNFLLNISYILKEM